MNRDISIQKHADILREGVYDGEPGAVVLFAEFLASEGLLGSTMDLSICTTVDDMVDDFLDNHMGQNVLIKWSYAEAYDQQETVELERAGL